MLRSTKIKKTIKASDKVCCSAPKIVIETSRQEHATKVGKFACNTCLRHGSYYVREGKTMVKWLGSKEIPLSLQMAVSYLRRGQSLWWARSNFNRATDYWFGGIY